MALCLTRVLATRPSNESVISDVVKYFLRLQEEMARLSKKVNFYKVEIVNEGG